MSRRQQGFTIVELMIATLVFAMVMVVITVGVLSFTRSYYKGLNQSKTQAAARAIAENISQAIQFSGSAVTVPIGQAAAGTPKASGFCIGSLRYSYVLGWQLVDGTPDAGQNQTRRAVILDEPGNCGGLVAQNLQAAVNGTELLSPMMRLSKLKVEPLPGSSDAWKVTVRVVYGDNDLLDDPTAETAKCKVSISGSQYCAQSELTTTVKKRIH